MMRPDICAHLELVVACTCTDMRQDGNMHA